MRIAGNTMRRNYLSRYEKNYSDKYGSEKKIYSGRQFDRGSENPINAAKALRIRKSISEVDTWQANLKTADSIYTNAETSMRTVSSIIQSVYEKLVEGAHGTRNLDDLEIIAKEVDNYAEEMVQSFNIDIADRKVFGALNNDSPAFKIETSTTGEKYVTYNGVAVNSSCDPNSFPYSGTSYLDIGIGMETNDLIDRIDDQSALPITFNGAECSGCGMTRKTASIDLKKLVSDHTYSLDVTVAGRKEQIEFTVPAGDADGSKTIETINEELRKAFKQTPSAVDDGTGAVTFKYLDNPTISPYKNLTVENNKINYSDLEPGSYYSIVVKTDDKERVVNFQVGSTSDETLENLDTQLKKQFGENAIASFNGGTIGVSVNRKEAALKTVNSELEDIPLTTDGKINFNSLKPGKTYAFSLGGTKDVYENGEKKTIDLDSQKIYFTAVADENGNLDTQATIDAINNYIDTNELFGEPLYPYISDTGTFCYNDKDASIIVDNSIGAAYEADITSIDGYANNIMQLVLDSAKLLRKGDQDMVARYADLIYAAQSNLSIAIADLGTNSKFIEFNQDRLSEVMINLQDKQNDIESTDLPSEITNWKVLESVYNATLQMGASVLSQTIFNYIS